MVTRPLDLRVTFHFNISFAAGDIEFHAQSFGDDRLPIGRIEDNILKLKPFLLRQRGQNEPTIYGDDTCSRWRRFDRLHRSSLEF